MRVVRYRRVRGKSWGSNGFSLNLCCGVAYTGNIRAEVLAQLDHT